METKTVVDIKKLEEQLAAARETARSGFLTSVNETLEQLRAIGFEYELKPVNGTEKPKQGNQCSICGEPGHSKRTCKHLSLGVGGRKENSSER
jgi:hypothetical protein